MNVGILFESLEMNFLIKTTNQMRSSISSSNLMRVNPDLIRSSNTQENIKIRHGPLWIQLQIIKVIIRLEPKKLRS